MTNRCDRDAAKWVASVRDRIEMYENGTPQYRLRLWRQAFSTAAYQAAFEPPQDYSTGLYALPATVDIVVDRACSKSYMTILADEEKVKVRKDLTNIVESADKVWINESEGVFEYPYKTEVVIARKK